MVLSAFTVGFIVGITVALVVFVVVFLLVFWFQRWRTRNGTLVASSDSYARVVDEARTYKDTAIEMGPPSSPTFTIGSDDDREDLVRAAVLELETHPELTPHEFESFWLSFQARENLHFSLTFGDTNIEEVLSSQRIKCMASGAVGPKKKYYFFARERNTGAPFLMEVFILPKEREMATEIRCASAVLLPDFVVYMKSAMRPFSRISGVQG